MAERLTLREQNVAMQDAIDKAIQRLQFGNYKRSGHGDNAIKGLVAVRDAVAHKPRREGSGQ